MERENDNIQKNTQKRGWLRKTARIIAVAVAAVVLVVVGLLTAIVVVLSPERLTPLVSKYSSEYIDGAVTARRIELTFWSTFPRLSVDIDSLALVSGALDRLDPEVRRRLPADADTLLTLRSLHGGLNLAALLAGRYELYDVALSQPAINIVVADDSTANYNIVPASDNDTDTGDKIPELSINRFLLLNSGPLRYFSLPDSTEFTLRFSAIDANGADSPRYSLSTEGNVTIAGLPLDTDAPLLFTADGNVRWDPSTPDELDLESFTVSIDGTPARFDTHIRFADQLTIQRLDIELPSVDVTRMAGYIPDGMIPGLDGVETNMNAAMSLTLTRPYTLKPDTVTLPSGQLTLKINPCRLSVKDTGISVDRLSLSARLAIDGDSLDLSEAEIEEFTLKSRMIDIDFNGNVRYLFSDPLFRGRLRGRAFTGYLPAVVKSAIPGDMKGTVGADLSVRLRRSYLTSERFHKIFARGTVSLRHFDMAMPVMPDSGDTASGTDTIRFYTPAAFLKFDSDRRIEVNGVQTDSLLTVTVKADTIGYSGAGVALLARDLNVGLGSRNVHSSADTTRINPFGGAIKASALRLTSLPDSLRIAVRNLDCNASLRRFEDRDSVPLLFLSVAADGVGVGDAGFRAAVKAPFAEMTAHLNPRKPKSERIARRENRQTPTEREDSTAGAGLKELIRRWKITGSLSATGGQLLSRSFPLATRISDVDLVFSSDSINLHSLSLQMGHTDLSVRGEITNLERWAVGRRASARRPIRMGVTINSDTVDIDQLTAAFLSGEADDAATGDMADLDEYAADVAVTDTTFESDSLGGPFIVPVNIEATVDVRANHIIYSGMLLHDFKGALQTRGGIMRLRDLTASGDVGTIDVSALYSSLDPDSLEFGMGMKLSDFYLERFLQMMPSIDSLLPAMRDLSGIVNADIAATTRLDREMNFVIPSLKAVIDIDGDSLVLLDADTFKSMSKWLVFKNKKRNLIDRMSVKIAVDSSMMSIYPFVFDIDRYRLGVMGSNDLEMNLNYHVSVLKSPLPWKFGINISGTPDNMKIRLGGAKVKENGEGAIEQMAIAETTRINLIGQLESLFNRGVGASRSSFMRSCGTLPPMQLDSVYSELPDSVIVTLTDSILPVQ